MNEKNQKKSQGQQVCMTIGMIVFLVLSIVLGFGGLIGDAIFGSPSGIFGASIGGAIAGGLGGLIGALLGAGIYYLFASGKE